MKYYSSIKLFLLNTPSLTTFTIWQNTEWLTDSLTDSAKNYRWVHPSSLNTGMSYFHFCHLYSQQEIKFWLIHLMSLLVGLYSRMFDSHIFKRYSPFWFLDPIKHLSVQFSSLLLAGNTCFNGLFQKKRNGGIDDILSWKNLRNSLETSQNCVIPLGSFKA